MRVSLFLLLFWLSCTLGVATTRAAADDQPRLRKVVALTRNGVCAPLQQPAVLAMWSTRPWPAWPVRPGFLTPRGAGLASAFWAAEGSRLRRLGLLPQGACPAGSVFVRADAEQRCGTTARAALRGLDAADLRYAMTARPPDPLFRPLQAGVLTLEPTLAAGNVMATAGGDLDVLLDRHAPVLHRLEAISAPLSPKLCQRYNLPDTCGLASLPNLVSVAQNGSRVRLLGALDIGARMVEAFLLEYSQWPGKDAGWGKVAAQGLAELLPLRYDVQNVVERTPDVARAKGTPLLAEMAAMLAGTHSDGRSNAARLVVLVGDDENLVNVGALLGIHWRLPGYPADATPPGTTLFLELWQCGDRQEVRLRVSAQPLEALHAPDGARAPVDGVVFIPPAVAQVRSSLEEFLQQARQKCGDYPLPPQLAPPLR